MTLVKKFVIFREIGGRCMFAYSIFIINPLTRKNNTNGEHGRPHLVTGKQISPLPLRDFSHSDFSVVADIITTTSLLQPTLQFTY